MLNIKHLTVQYLPRKPRLPYFVCISKRKSPGLPSANQHQRFSTKCREGDIYLEKQYEILLLLKHCWLWLSMLTIAKDNWGLCSFIAEVAGLLELKLTALAFTHSPNLSHMLMMEICSTLYMKWSHSKSFYEVKGLGGKEKMSLSKHIFSETWCPTCHHLIWTIQCIKNLLHRTMVLTLDQKVSIYFLLLIGSGILFT